MELEAVIGRVVGQAVTIDWTAPKPHPPHTNQPMVVTRADGERFFAKLLTFGHHHELPLAKRVSEASQVASWTEEYHRRLQRLGVAVPGVYSVQPFTTGTDVGILEIASNEGVDLGRYLRQLGDTEAVNVLMELTTALARVFGQQHVGIDARPDNFTWQAGRLCYVDLFPPRFVLPVPDQTYGAELLYVPPLADEPTTEYARKRYYHPPSILRRLRFLLGQLHQRLPALLGRAIEGTFPASLAALVSAGEARLPATRIELLEERERRTLIAALGVPDFDDLRLLFYRWVPPAVRAEQLNLVDLPVTLPLAEKIEKIEALKRLITPYL